MDDPLTLLQVRAKAADIRSVETHASGISLHDLDPPGASQVSLVGYLFFVSLLVCSLFVGHLRRPFCVDAGVLVSLRPLL